MNILTLAFSCACAASLWISFILYIIARHIPNKTVKKKVLSKISFAFFILFVLLLGAWALVRNFNMPLWNIV